MENNAGLVGGEVRPLDEEAKFLGLLWTFRGPKMPLTHPIIQIPEDYQGLGPGKPWEAS